MAKGIEPKSQVSIVFTGPFENDEMHRVLVYDRVDPALGQAAFDCLCLAPNRTSMVLTATATARTETSSRPNAELLERAQRRALGLGLLAMPSLMLIAILVAVPVLWMLSFYPSSKTVSLVWRITSG